MKIDVLQDIRLGAHATEAEVKRLGQIPVGAERSALQDYRIVHFATHGSLTNLERDQPGLPRGEPGLILSRPAVATAEDDGYLSASEVAGLNLDADWVILSACSTAAGTLDNTETLSGLARAFFYAGARALLVSNWDIFTNAAVELTTRTFAALEVNSKVSRGEAMRDAIASMIKVSGNADDAFFRLQPAYWGGFTLVGEGGR